MLWSAHITGDLAAPEVNDDVRIHEHVKLVLALAEEKCSMATPCNRRKLPDRFRWPFLWFETTMRSVFIDASPDAVVALLGSSCSLCSGSGKWQALILQ